MLPSCCPLCSFPPASPFLFPALPFPPSLKPNSPTRSDLDPNRIEFKQCRAEQADEVVRVPGRVQHVPRRSEAERPRDLVQPAGSLAARGERAFRFIFSFLIRVSLLLSVGARAGPAPHMTLSIRLDSRAFRTDLLLARSMYSPLPHPALISSSPPNRTPVHDSSPPSVGIDDPFPPAFGPPTLVEPDPRHPEPGRPRLAGHFARQRGRHGGDDLDPGFCGPAVGRIGNDRTRRQNQDP